MYILVYLIILCVVFAIFFGTITSPSRANNLWFKARLKINHDIIAGWYREISKRKYVFYTLNGELIDQDKNRVSIVEHLSNTGNPPVSR